MKIYHPGTRFRIGIYLANSRAPACRLSELTIEAWGHDPDGGPKDARANLGVHIANLRRMFRPHGVAIETVHGYGWRIPKDQRAKAAEVLIAVFARSPSVAASVCCPHCGRAVPITSKALDAEAAE